MANVTETPTYPDGIYRIETTDPVIGGEDGISNVQAKQLANRTAWLKVRADQVDVAKGEQDSLGERLDALQAMAEAVGPEMQNATVGAVKFAIDQAGQANASIHLMRNVWTQRGNILLTNRGVISGCVVTRSTGATRNLNLSAGRCFAGGMEWPVLGGLNAASVPSNPGQGSITAYAYLHPVGYYNYSLAVTAEGEEIPGNGILIYELVIPSGNTDATDPDISGVTITDLRRLEPNFPVLLDEPCLVYVPISVLPYHDYHLSLYAINICGQRLFADAVTSAFVGPNGFTFELHTTDDDVVAFWQVLRLDT